MEPISLSLSTAFAVWAAVVALIGTAIVWELSRLRKDVQQMSNLLHDHILHTERRQTHTETFLSIKHDDFKPLTLSK